MKFSHIADCHVGSWRDPKLRDISANAFIKAIDISIEKNVDFVLIAGDLFNTSFPAIDSLKAVVKKLKELKKHNIPCYIIAGSHDFSPSGKTMLDVLEEAGLFINVFRGSVDNNNVLKLKFTVDEKTGAKITGMLGRAGTLDKKYYEQLDKTSLEAEEGFKIFMFHTAITEYKPEEIDKEHSSPLNMFPKGFDYYAGGHVHYILEKNEKQAGYGLIVYPGPLFPNNFKELEELSNGGFYIYDSDDRKLERQEISFFSTIKLSVDCKNKAPEAIRQKLFEKINNESFDNALVLLRLYGKISEGKISDINLKEITEKLYEKGAYFVMRNTAKLASKDFEQISIDTSKVDDMEDSIIKEHLGQVELPHDVKEKELLLTRKLMHVLANEREEGEVVKDFEQRVKEDIDNEVGVVVKK